MAHYFHYDSKFRSTIKPFLTKPGQLTKDYIAGRRVAHIPTVSLYLFITLIYFLCAPFFKKVNNIDAYSYNSMLKQDGSDDERKLTEEVFRRYRRMNILTSDSTVESYRQRQAKLSESERDNAVNSFWKERNNDRACT